MNSNERPFPWHRHDQKPFKTPVQEDTLRLEQWLVERKMIVCALKENPRGRFLRISEQVGGKRNSIIIPAAGLEQLRSILDEMIRINTQLPQTVTQSPAAPLGS